MIKTESYQKGILLSTGLNILAKGIAFANTLIITYFFGTQVQTDLYYYILGVVALITSVINGIDLLVLIPEAMRLREQKSEFESQNFLNFFIWLYALIGFLFAMLAFTCPIFFFSIFSQFDIHALEQHKTILIIGALFIFFQLLNSLLSSILISYKFFTVPILAGLINSLFTIFFTLVFKSSVGIIGTMQGLLVGYIINLVLLLFLLIKQINWKILKIKVCKNGKIWSTIGFMQINMLPVWLRNSTTLFLLTGLGGGLLTKINLALQVVAILDVFIVSQIISAVGIKFNELIAVNDIDGLNQVFVKTAKVLFIICIPIVIIIFFYNIEVVDILFKRGDFTENDAKTLCFCLSFLIFMSPLTTINALGTRIITSLQKINRIIIPTICTHLLFLALAYFFIKKWGITGYLTSTIIGYLLIVVLMIVLFKYYFSNIQFFEIIRELITQLILNIIPAFGIWFLLSKIEMKPLLTLFIASTCQLLIALGSNFKFLKQNFNLN